MDILVEKLMSVDFIGIGGRILGALLILVIGWWGIKLILKALKTLMNRQNLDKSLQGFLISLVGWGLKAFLFVTVAGELGIETTSFAAIIAAAGLAVGMALQGSLSNFAGGALMMVFKPFRVGDFIEAQGVQGIVKKIEIFTTTLNTIDNKEVILPNGVLSNGTIINYSSEENRRVDLTFGVAYSSDIRKVKEVLMNVVEQQPLVLKNPKPTVVLTKINTSSIDFETRTWVKSADYWTVYSDILEKVKVELDREGIEIPYPHTVEIHKQA